jgi:2',3'-cyclic-nucleotide 2'-phosphodiesterase (5'-nucleotidase family)
MPHLTRRAALASLAAGTSFTSLRAYAEPAAHLTFLLVNDVYEMDENAQRRGGFARLATVVRTERARALREGRKLIFVHAGDTLSPSLMSSFDQGEHMIALFNALGLDLFVPGNHEFDFGVDVYSKRMAEAQFAILAANLRDAAGESLPHHQDVLNLDLNGLKVALIGSAYDATPAASRSESLMFAPTYAMINKQAKAARQGGADFVVAIVHADKATGNALMAAHQVDVVLSGHNHDLHLDFDGRTALAESHQDANYVVVIDIDVAKSKTDPSGLTWWPDFKVIDTASVVPDEEILAQIRAYQSTLSSELDVEVATLAAKLDSRTELVRSQECAVGNFVADALRAAANADIAITNGGGIRGNRIYEAGTAWTRRDVLSELPFGNKVVTLKVTGQAILAALENGVSRLPQASGRFPQVSGVKVTIAPSASAGSRVQSVTVNGEMLDPARIYRLATNDFMARGGDGYAMLSAGAGVTVDTGDVLLARAVMDYAQRLHTVAAQVDGRMIVI